jgi:hypothetical protein
MEQSSRSFIVATGRVVTEQLDLANLGDIRMLEPDLDSYARLSEKKIGRWRWHST